jgi:two-component system, NtrC family, sensor kinase
MRLGIRLQLLFALGSLLVLAFVPLFFAVASLTRATMSSARTSSARALGRAVAGHVTAAQLTRAAEDIEPLLEAQVGQEGVAAIGIYDASGKQVARAGSEAAAALPAEVPPGIEEVAPVQTSFGDGVLVTVPGDRAAPAGAVAVVVRTDLKATRGAPLVRLVALYTGVVALALLIFAYFSMTRLVVQPIEELSRAARRVADGARTLEAPGRGARELTDLGASLALMTERLRADEESLRTKIVEIERYAGDLSRAQERLIRSERLASVGRLAAGLAHEIGNPLSAILGFQELLLQGGLDAQEQRDFLERMKRETERIHHVLRDMLDFARPAASIRPGRPEPPGAVTDAVADVSALLTPQKSFRGVELRTELAADLPRVSLSHPRLVQVLLNLLLNAADAIPKEGGWILLRASQCGDNRVRVEVEDNGPGIAKEIRDRLFEPFATTKEVGQGTGLGLAVCRGLVEAAGGTLVVEEGTLGGARFVMELPTELPVES